MEEATLSKEYNAITSADIAASLDAYHGELADWINDLIEGDALDLSSEREGSQSKPVDLTELDGRVALLSTKLEVACQDTSSQLERAIEDISRNVPRINFDLQFMRESALALQRELNTIHQSTGNEISKTYSSVRGEVPTSAEKDATTKALEQIKYLDAVRKGMEAARAVLQEAENWSTLESEITTLLKENSYSKAATRLSEAAKSMSVFQHTPEYEARRTLMINLQNQTEAALSSALVASINSRDIAACKNFYEIFSKIEREGEFRNYYFGARRLGILDLWNNAVLSDVHGEKRDPNLSDDSGPSRGYSLKFNELLGRFYADLLTLINEERSSIPTIFSSIPDPTSIISHFITSIFESLVPSFSQRLSGMAAHYGITALSELLSVFRATEDFALKVEKVLEKVAMATASALAPTSPIREEPPPLGKGHSRSKSKRLSISRRIPPHRASQSFVQGIGGAVVADTIDYTWEQALFEPFIDFQSDYITLEKRLLEDALKTLESQRAGMGYRDAEVKARMLREKAVDVLGFAEECLGRCLAFTHGYGVVGAIHAVDDLFTLFFNNAKNDLLQPPRRPQRSSMEAMGRADRFDEELLNQEELAAFQLSLNLLNVIRALKERIDALDSKYRVQTIQVARSIRTTHIHSGSHQIAGAPRGEAELLAQSTLNSMDLSNLLESVDPEPPMTSFLSTPSAYGSAPPTPLASASSVNRSESGNVALRTQPILQGSYRALTEFARETQIFLQNLILTPLFSYLAGYPLLTAWASNTNEQAQRSRVFDTSLPTFSLSPTPVMQRVCDSLMALPRIFQDYAGDDEALGFSLETLPHVEKYPGLKEYLDWTVQGPQYPVEKDPQGSPRSKRMSISSPSFRRLSFSSSNLAGGYQQSKPPVLSAETIEAAWLSSITYTLLCHFTQEVLPLIPSISTAGAAQLAYDLGDLSTMSKALNADWEDLEKWKEYCEMSHDEGRRRWLMIQGASAFAEGAHDGQAVERDDVFRLIAHARGWTG
ncbi:hypothetical protein CPB86DRAFT_729002 [Serendipita vermifera]|nr:hypothetical protein CPB86DRAFT_729002 [Serendipita vermifera]